MVLVPSRSREKLILHKMKKDFFIADYTHGQSNAFIKILAEQSGYEDVVERTLRGEITFSVNKKPSEEKTLLIVWKTIKLGTIKNADEFRKALKKAGSRISDWANDIIGKPAFTVASSEEEIQLVNLSVEELGFKNGAKYGDICARAKELGLELCPNEVGPQLRLQYKDQPKGEWLRIAMEPITDSDGDLFIFLVVHDDGDLWLGSNYGPSGYFWGADDRFVFRLRK